MVASRGADDTLKSLSKVVRILDCFSTTNRALSLSEVCERTGYPRSTTHRLLASLKEVGFLDQDKQRDRYRLGIKLFELGNTVLSSMDLHREARPFVEQLGRLTGHLVHLAVFDGRQAVVIHRSDPSADSHAPITHIEAAPVHCTSVGKAILAFQPQSVLERIIEAGLRRFTTTTISDPDELRRELETTRQRGYAIDNAEHQPGLRCIGAPIRDQHGRVIAGISISGPAFRLPDAQIDALAEMVVYNANAVSAQL
ncbi:IclR family transcriptional regulator [Bosea sp. PAMC 26642]|uniref:IclR family transcriptional regulator n=1 Tax=Bosea sp. (strain PAMC 26642) TaxID=1792307 RepID=UPI000770496B|nr:IclR family transcriptional regulator [Bosea sp. PAMC 26642]AMJ63719.1 transcriptional regulator [Bosea sp. PAMC 26642]